MKIKDISVRTLKNHVETEVSFDSLNFKQNCYLVQSVYLASDKEIVSCQMTAGIPFLKVMTCADAVPAIPSTEKEKHPYNLLTRIFDEKDELMDERTVSFTFSLPKSEEYKKRKSFLKKVFER
ncbi:hypothetical protein [Treponema sp.]|uniref:hypothetical protein n=1 Tax=Treponema sp. TaxID=166 RepID=UPI00298DC5B2|nr:hypothetical protein [Treponema sp.]MCQ2241587.1 hypothetical protein [Treponema sp.]